jgi:hypothetical protein
MALTFVQLQDEVLAHGFAESYRTRVKRWINEAQWKTARRVPLREFARQDSVPTIAGSATLATLGPYSRIRDIVLTEDGTELAPVTIEWMDRMTLANQGRPTGRPQFYAVTNTDEDAPSLVLWPVPDAAYAMLLRYEYAVPEMTADGDDPLIPDPYADLMVSYALSRAYRSEDDQERAAAFMSDYERTVSELRADRMREVPTVGKQVPGMWGDRRFEDGGDRR